MSLSPELQPLTDAIDPQQLRRALVIKLRHHGDVLLTSPVLATLKAHAPQCEIDALIFADTAPMLSEHPALSQLHLIDRNWKKQGTLAQIAPEWALLKALKSRQYDLIIHLTDHPRGAWLTRLLRPRWSIAPARDKKKSKWWKNSFTHLYRYPANGTRHAVECNLDALRRLGLQPTESQKRLMLTTGAAADEKISAILREKGISPKSFIHFHPTSRWFFKTWSVAQNAELLRALTSQGEKIILTAAPDAKEQAMIDAILQHAGSDVARQIITLSGKLSLKELAALTAQAKLFIGVDSAPMHIAAAVDTPVVALFGPSGDKEWGPWKVAHVIMTSAHTCRPCGRDGCGGGKISECLYQISVDEVLQAITRVMK